MNYLHNIINESKKLLCKRRSFIVILLLSILFALFTQCGHKLDFEDKIDWFNWFLYVKLFGWTIVYFLAITILFSIINLYNINRNNKSVFLKDSSSNFDFSWRNPKFKIFIIGSVLAFIVYLIVYFAAYPGYYCYDSIHITKFIENGFISNKHSPLQIVICALIMKPIISLGGSWNLAISVLLWFIFWRFLFLFYEWIINYWNTMRLYG